MNKHRLKAALRSSFSWVLWHSGLWRVFHVSMRRRLVILAGHCVGEGRGLPADMTLSPQRLRTIIAALSKGFASATIGEGVQAIQSSPKGRSLFALSFDDGYRDNHDVLLPILLETGARATVFLEGRPLSERRVSWSHQFFWLIHVAKVGAPEIATWLCDHGGEGWPLEALRKAAVTDEGAEYRVKRVLKYDCPVEARDLLLRRLFQERGGNEAALCDALYMTPAMAQTLQTSGVELGGHTYSHEVLSSLEPKDAARDIEQGRSAMAQVLGPRLSASFAYPYGRRWDFRREDREAVKRAGYDLAVTTHPGVFDGRGDRCALGRVMVDETTPIHHIVCEASGAFQWLRRLGLELAE